MLLSKSNTQSKPLVVIDYTDNRLTYLGRWLNGAYGKTSGWSSSSVQFRVKNTSTVKVKAYINRTQINGGGALGYHINGDPNQTAGIAFETNTAAFAGYRTASIPVVNNGSWQDMIIHIYGVPADQFNQVTELFLDSIILDAGGELDVLTQGAKKIQFIGDSWMATSNDWPRLIDSSLYSCIQIAGSGYTLDTANTRYPFDYNGSTNTTDESVDAIVISFGVNDYIGAVTVGNFQTQLLSLIDKVQIKQPSKPIFLVRVPNNGANLYGQYLTAMNNAAGLRSNIIVIDTTSIDASVDRVDSGHLGANGKLVYLAPLVKTTLIANGI